MPTSWSFIQGHTASGISSTLANTYTSNTTNGNLLVGAFVSSSSATITVADSFGSWASAGTPVTIAGDSTKLWIFYSVNNSGGPNTVTATATGGVVIDSCIHEYHNTEGSDTPLDVYGTNTGSSTTPTGPSLTPSGVDELCFAAAMQGGSATLTAGGSFTLRETVTGSGETLATEDQFLINVATAGSFSSNQNRAWAVAQALFVFFTPFPPPNMLAGTLVNTPPQPPPPLPAPPSFIYQPRTAPVLVAAVLRTDYKVMTTQAEPPPPMPAPPGWSYQPFVPPVVVDGGVPPPGVQMSTPPQDPGPSLPPFLSAPRGSGAPVLTGSTQAVITQAAPPPPLPAPPSFIHQAVQVFSQPSPPPAPMVTRAVDPPQAPAMLSAVIQPPRFNQIKAEVPTRAMITAAEPPPPLPAAATFLNVSRREPDLPNRQATTPMTTQAPPPPLAPTPSWMGHGFKDTITFQGPKAFTTQAEPPPMLAMPSWMPAQNRQLPPVAPPPLQVTRASDPPAGPAVPSFVGGNRSLPAVPVTRPMQTQAADPPMLPGLPSWIFQGQTQGIQLVTPPPRLMVTGAEPPPLVALASFITWGSGSQAQPISEGPYYVAAGQIWFPGAQAGQAGW